MKLEVLSNSLECRKIKYLKKMSYIIKLFEKRANLESSFI